MTGCKVGFCDKLEQFLGRTVLKYYCLIHQQSLSGKSLQMKNVMSMIMKWVNNIRATALKRREFRRLLNEVDEQYVELLLHTEVRWLSRWKVLAWFLAVKDHVYNLYPLHLQEKHLPEITSPRRTDLVKNPKKQNPKRTKIENEQNPDLDIFPNWTKFRMDKIPIWINSWRDKILIWTNPD